MPDPFGSTPYIDKAQEISSGVRENNFLEPVPPFKVGEGLPYAPVDWPNPGDTWGWKVGRRFNASGYYTDRFLYLPKSLQKISNLKQFSSRLAVERYIESEFPDADTDAFFASFSWKVPSTLKHSIEVKAESFCPEKVKEEGKEESSPATKTKRKHTAATSLAKRRTRRSLQQSVSVTTEDTGEVNGLHSLNEVAASNAPRKKYMKSTTDIEDNQPDNVSFVGSDSPSEYIPEDFNSYLDSLVDNLAQPLTKASLAYPATTNSLAQENELAQSRIVNKAKVTSPKEEYNKGKEKVTQLQAGIDSSLLAVKEIDNQIARLESQRAELMRTIETKKDLIAKLTTDQQKVAYGIQGIMNQVQVANSKEPE